VSSFRFEASDGAGRIEKGLVEAESPTAARAALRARGLVPLEVELQGGGRAARYVRRRFNDAELTTLGMDAEYRPDPRWRVGVQAIRYNESRDRPDATAIDWDQFRLAGRITLLFGTNADRVRLPPAVRREASP